MVGSKQPASLVRGGRRIQKPLPRGVKAPRTGTINTENTVLRGIFDHAKNQRWVTIQQIPEIKNQTLRKAEAKMERATNNAISKAHSAGAKSAAGRGVQNLKYRD